jgi:hypothetical protein
LINQHASNGASVINDCVPKKTWRTTTREETYRGAFDVCGEAGDAKMYFHSSFFKVAPVEVGTDPGVGAPVTEVGNPECDRAIPWW